MKFLAHEKAMRINNEVYAQQRARTLRGLARIRKQLDAHHKQRSGKALDYRYVATMRQIAASLESISNYIADVNELDSKGGGA